MFGSTHHILIELQRNVFCRKQSPQQRLVRIFNKERDTFSSVTLDQNNNFSEFTKVNSYIALILMTGLLNI